MSFKNKFIKLLAEAGVIFLAFLGLFAVGLAITFCISGGVMTVWGMITGFIPQFFSQIWKIELFASLAFAFVYLMVSLIEAVVDFNKGKKDYKERLEKSKNKK